METKLSTVMSNRHLSICLLWSETYIPWAFLRLKFTDNHDGVITHLEPDILKCEVKWALGSITTNKVSGGDGISIELFKILKDDAVKVLSFNMSANLENSAVATELEKVSFHSNPKEGQC